MLFDEEALYVGARMYDDPEEVADHLVRRDATGAFDHVRVEIDPNGDDLTGFLVACALVRPNQIMDLEPPSVKKKLNDSSFAAAIDRDHLRQACEELGEDYTEHIAFVTEAMRGIADTLELTGQDA